MNQKPLYPYSAEEARIREELPLWRASHRANVACKEAIEAAIRQHFDGSYLENNCLDDVLKEYGYERTTWVLANTIQQKDWDGRFSDRNQAWAKSIPIPQDKRHNLEFVVSSHPAVLDGVVNQYRKTCQTLSSEDLSCMTRRELERTLAERIQAEWTEYERELLALTPRELINRAEDIAAAQLCRDEMTQDIDSYSDELLEFVNSLSCPLLYLRDRWVSEQDVDHHEELSNALWRLLEEFQETPEQGGMTME